jgi:hypothetical protein
MVRIVIEHESSEMIRFGADEIRKVLRKKGLAVEIIEYIDRTGRDELILLGNVKENKFLKELVKQGKLIVPERAESFTISVLDIGDTKVICVAGSDDRGAMYGALELAEQFEEFEKREDLFSLVQPKSISPMLSIRGVNFYLVKSEVVNKNSSFHSEEFWKGYFDMMARCRLNFLDLHGLYEESSTRFINLFTYFIKSDKYSQIASLDDESLKRNIEMLKKIIQMGKARGVDVCLANQTGAIKSYPLTHKPGLEGWYVDTRGLSKEDLEQYTRDAVKILLKECPDLSYIGLRVAESGVSEDFYAKTYIRAFNGSSDHKPNIIIRTWGAEKSKIVEIADNYKGKVFVEIKYNGEHLGLPYHAITSLSALYGQTPSYTYENYTNYPRNYDIIWQIRANGTHRIFRWGDPEFVKRCVKSCLFGGGVGFSLECVSGMYFHIDFYHSDKVNHDYYKYDYERDWFWFLLWGRLAYDPNTDEKVWKREFKKRFGAAADQVYEAYVWGSKIVPLIYSSHRMGLDCREMAPEFEIGGNLHDLRGGFLICPPLDINTTFSIREYVESYLTGQPRGKLTPPQICDMLEQCAQKSISAIRNAESKILGENKEFECTKMDVEALYHLALYYKEKILAAMHLTFYFYTREQVCLQKARECMLTAAKHWEELAKITELHYKPFYDMYRMNTPKFHWKDELPKLKRDFDLLEMYGRDPPDQSFLLVQRYKKALSTKRPYTYVPKEEELPVISHTPVKEAKIGTDILIKAHVSSKAKLMKVMLHYKPVPSIYDWSTIPMTSNGDEYTANIPASIVTSEGIMYYIEAVDIEGNGIIYPNPLKETPYIVILTVPNTGCC